MNYKYTTRHISRIKSKHSKIDYKHSKSLDESIAPVKTFPRSAHTGDKTVTNYNIFNCDHWVSLDISDQYLCMSHNHIYLQHIHIQMRNVDSLLGSSNVISLVMFEEHTQKKSESVFVCHPLWSGSSGSLGWSHRGRLQRQPSWKRWYRPGTVCFCLWAFCLPPNRIIPHLQFSVLSLFQSCHLPHLHCRLLLSHANTQILWFANVEKQVRR